MPGVNAPNVAGPPRVSARVAGTLPPTVPGWSTLVGKLVIRAVFAWPATSEYGQADVAAQGPTLNGVVEDTPLWLTRLKAPHGARGGVLDHDGRGVVGPQ